MATRPLALDGSVLELASDGTGRRRPRPRAPTRQRDHDRGQQQAHTDQTMLVVQATPATVSSLGATGAGKPPAKQAADAAALAYPVHAPLATDTGCPGDEPPGVPTRHPQQQPNNNALRVAERVLHGLSSGVRGVGEHGLAGVKRCRLVKEVVRLTPPGIAALVMEIACGLHTLRVTYRHPLLAFNMQNLLNSA